MTFYYLLPWMVKSLENGLTVTLKKKFAIWGKNSVHHEWIPFEKGVRNEIGGVVSLKVITITLFLLFNFSVC